MDYTKGLKLLLYFSLALAVGDPHAKVPCGKLKPNNVIGWPSSVYLCNPSAMPQDKLQLLYDNMANIKFVGKFNWFSM